MLLVLPGGARLAFGSWQSKSYGTSLSHDLCWWCTRNGREWAAWLTEWANNLESSAACCMSHVAGNKCCRRVWVVRDQDNNAGAAKGWVSRMDHEMYDCVYVCVKRILLYFCGCWKLFNLLGCFANSLLKIIQKGFSFRCRIGFELNFAKKAAENLNLARVSNYV